MHGLVSILDETHFTKVTNLWDKLEEKYNLKGIRVTPIPHFSWQVAKDYNFTELEAVIEKVSQKISPFKIRTSGLGVFTGEFPVVYLAVVNDLNLIKIHSIICEGFNSIAIEPLIYYQPNLWVPHISLAYTDVNSENIGFLMKEISFIDFHWEISINNLAFIFEPDGEIGKVLYKSILSKK